METKNLINQRFGKLTVVEQINESSEKGPEKFRCLCDCGKDMVANVADVLSGEVLSCGCHETDTDDDAERKRVNKEEIKIFKAQADAFNKGLYSDIDSYRNGLMLVLVIASIVILCVAFM